MTNPPMRNTLRALAGSVAVTAVAAGMLPTAGGASAGAAGPRAAATSDTTVVAASSLADRIDLPKGTRQLVTVTSKGWGSTIGRLRVWRKKPNGHWRTVMGPWRAVIGYSGWVRASKRRQSTGTTPAGDFRLRYAFGRLADPGTELHYRRFDGNDYWPYEPRDPATYNIYQRHKAPSTHWRSDYVERLADYPGQYAYAAVVGFNLPGGVHYSADRRQWVARRPADTSRGGGIFLHVQGNGKTAGCVALPRRGQVRRIIRWLDPDKAPRIVMGPGRYVRRL